MVSLVVSQVQLKLCFFNWDSASTYYHLERSQKTLIGATSRFVLLAKFSLNFSSSSFAIRVYFLRNYSVISFRFILTSLVFVYPSKLLFYFKVPFYFKNIFLHRNNHSKSRDVTATDFHHELDALLRVPRQSLY